MLSAPAGLLGDRCGRKFTDQFNLAILGLASFACASAPTMLLLVAARFVCEIGLVTAGRITSISLPFVIVSLFEWHGVMALVGLVSILLLVQVGPILVFGRKTRGRSLEAINETSAAHPTLNLGREAATY